MRSARILARSASGLLAVTTYIAIAVAAWARLFGAGAFGILS